MKSMAELRKEITDIDKELLALFARRFTVVREVGEYKKHHNLPVRDKERERELVEILNKQAEALSISEDFVKSVWTSVFQESYKQEA